MATSGLVMVSAEDDIGPAQNIIELRPPLSRPHRIACRQYSVLAQHLDIFFALDHVNHMLSGNVLD